MLPEFTDVDLATALDAVVEQVLNIVGIDRPPVDAFAVAHTLGMEIAWDSSQAGRGRIVKLNSHTAGRPPQVSILLRPEPRSERRQWAVAHEIGEALAWQVFEEIGVDPREAPPDTRERVANHFAGRLLAPTCFLGDDAAECGWDLFHLKSSFSTASHELLARRMLDFSVPIVMTIFDLGQVTFRRTNIDGPLPPISAVERR